LKKEKREKEREKEVKEKFSKIRQGVNTTRAF